jgi:hypothetical protein
VRLIGLGIPGLLGALLLAAGCAFLALVHSPMERRHAALSEQAQQAVKRRIQGDAKLIAVSAPEGKLASFYAFFRGDTAVTDYLVKLHSLARTAGVDPRQADYRLADARGLRLTEYSITMPLTGSYSQLRTFLESALDEVPVLTLDHISLRRKRVTDHQVEAEVRFTLFVNQP